MTKNSAPKLTPEERAAAREARRSANKEKLRLEHAARDEVRRAKREADRAAKHSKNSARHRELTEKHMNAIVPPLPPFEEILTECSDDLLLAIFERVSSGELFSRVCHEHGIKTTKVTAYINRTPETRALWETARRAQSEAWSDKLVELAMSATPEDVQVIRNEIDVRRWLMGKNNIRFAERTSVTVSGEVNHNIRETIRPGMTTIEAVAEFAETRRLVNGENT